MTVSELISKLRALPSDAVVVTPMSESLYSGAYLLVGADTLGGFFAGRDKGDDDAELRDEYLETAGTSHAVVIY